MHNGKAIEEKYETKAKGAIGPDGKRIVERQQMYANSGTGLHKVANERMLNDKGHKVVRERLGGAEGPVNSFDHYRNMREEQASAFQQEWEAEAKRMGFGSNNRLGIGHDRSDGRGQRQMIAGEDRRQTDVRQKQQVQPVS